MLNVKDLQLILRKLSNPRARLTRNNDSTWTLIVSSQSAKKNRVFSEETVRALHSEGLLTSSGHDGYVLSAAGHAALTRLQSTSDVFRRQHQSRKVLPTKTEDGRMIELDHNLSESPLAWLRARKDSRGAAHISDEQYRAGERLRADFTKAAYIPKTTASWSPTASVPGRKKYGARQNNAADISDKALIARERVDSALDRVGPELSNILLEVCCYLKRIEEAEKSLGFPQRSGKLVLKLALTALARHYGYISDNVHRDRKVAHWAREGYRPEIQIPK